MSTPLIFMGLPLMRKSEFRERRAISAHGPLWQSRAGNGSGRTMMRSMAFAASFLMLSLASSAGAVPGGEIGTLDIGRYVCELPGDASGPAGRAVPALDFSIVNASSYRSGGTMGSYLLTGDRLVMTSGLRKGERYHRVSRDFLRRVGADGRDTALRCVRSSRHRG
jgi:hypothetical protein